MSYMDEGDTNRIEFDIEDSPSATTRIHKSTQPIIPNEFTNGIEVPCYLGMNDTDNPFVKNILPILHQYNLQLHAFLVGFLLLKREFTDTPIVFNSKKYDFNYTKLCEMVINDFTNANVTELFSDIVDCEANIQKSKVNNKKYQICPTFTYDDVSPKFVKRMKVLRYTEISVAYRRTLVGHAMQIVGFLKNSNTYIYDVTTMGMYVKFAAAEDRLNQDDGIHIDWNTTTVIIPNIDKNKPVIRTPMWLNMENMVAILKTLRSDSNGAARYSITEKKIKRVVKIKLNTETNQFMLHLICPRDTKDGTATFPIGARLFKLANYMKYPEPATIGKDGIPFRSCTVELGEYSSDEIANGTEELRHLIDPATKDRLVPINFCAIQYNGRASRDAKKAVYDIYSQTRSAKHGIAFAEPVVVYNTGFCSFPTRLRVDVVKTLEMLYREADALDKIDKKTK